MATNGNTKRRGTFVRAAVVLLAVVCVAQQYARAQASAPLTGAPAPLGTGMPQGQGVLSPASPGGSGLPVYANIPDGLREFMRAALNLEKYHNTKALDVYARSLVLPNAGVWFREAFGNRIGQQLADSYSRMDTEMPLWFPQVLREANKNHLKNVSAVLFTDSCNPASSLAEYQVLVSRKNRTPLYDVRIASPSEGIVLKYFAYVDGGFRYLGDFQLNVPPAVFQKEYRDVPPDAMAGRLLNPVVKMNPKLAKFNRAGGSVVLRGIIGSDGNVCSLDVVSGQPGLSAEAIASVQEWRYRPYKVEGKPVSVNTTITVKFNKGG